MKIIYILLLPILLLTMSGCKKSDITWTATASSNLPGELGESFNVSHVLDGNLDTCFSTLNGDPQHLILEASSVVQLKGITLFARNGAGVGIICFPEEFTISHSLDGKTWTVYKNQTYENYNDPAIENIFIFDKAVKLKYIKISVTKNGTDKPGDLNTPQEPRYFQLAEVTFQYD